MAINVRSLTPHQAAQVLGTDESHFVELKSVDVRPADLTKTLSAFANADGGELYVGVDENRRSSTKSWRGFPSQEPANGHIQILEQLFPLGRDFSYEFLRAVGHDGLVLHISVAKTRDVKLSSSGFPYLRRWAQNLPVKSAEARERLRRNKGLTSFESEVVDEDSSIVTRSETMQFFISNVVPTARPRQWLIKQRLLKGDKPTVAAVLLFADEPQTALPKRSSVKVYRYETSDAEGSRDTLAGKPATIEGNIYSQIRHAVFETVRMVEAPRVIRQTGLEHASYPSEALHEIITNAVLHRDYAISDDVHIRVFNNRIEVESPGRLPGHVTVRNILRERFARNAVLVRLLNKFPDPPNKDVGEGLNTAFTAMKRHQLKTPRIVELPNAVEVQLRHERLGTPEEIVLAYLTERDEINNTIGRELTGIGSENKMKRVFERLMLAGEIERIPGRRGNATAYQRSGRDLSVQLELLADEP